MDRVRNSHSVIFTLLWCAVQWVLTMLRAVNPPLQYYRNSFIAWGSHPSVLSLWLAFSRMYYKWKYILCSFLDLVSSLRKINLRFIHVAQISSFACVLVPLLFIYSPVRHLGCFTVFTIMNKAAISFSPIGFCVSIRFHFT